METLNHSISAESLINQAKEASLKASLVEQEVKSQPPNYTIEDYVDSQESLNAAHRYLAKAYIEMRQEQIQEGFQDTGLEAEEDTPPIVVDAQTIIKQKDSENWEEHFPKDNSEEEQVRWQTYVSGFQSQSVQDCLKYLYRATLRHQDISSTPGLQEKIAEFKDKKQEVFANVAAYRHLEREEQSIILQMESLYARATSLGEDGWHDTEQLEALENSLSSITAAKETIVLEDDGAVEELARRRLLDSKRQLEEGVLMTDQMTAAERVNLPVLLKGQPLLLVGETGGAKTALARHMAREILSMTGKGSKEPEVISGSPEITAYQLMGKPGLKSNREGATVTFFEPGPMVRAMEEGRPIILDEINAIPAEILKRLNIIMQLRPGQKYTVQEDSGMEVTVASGFCIIATMNEKSHRYRGVEELSTEFRDRFGVNIAKINYPDQDVTPGSETIPQDLLNLALLTCMDKFGNTQLRNMTLDELISLVRVAHMTQIMYTHPSGDAAFANYLSTDRAAESGTTALSEKVISPRTMVQIISKVRDSNGKTTLKEQLAGFIENTTNKIDKQIIINLLENYGLRDTK